MADCIVGECYHVEDLAGRVFGLWTVLRYVYTARSKHYWLCRCACGLEKPQESYSLRAGRTRACRKCSATIIVAPRITKHKRSASKLYRTWSSIKQRCGNPKFKSGYRYHGALGVRVCDEWLYDFQAFADYMGEPPTPQHSIDRYPNPSGNYEPGNVRWATQIEQVHNRRPGKPAWSRVNEIAVEDLSGRQFGLWSVLHHSHTSRSRHYWLSRCACGVTKPVGSYSLRSGRSRACRKCSSHAQAA